MRLYVDGEEPRLLMMGKDKESILREFDIKEYVPL